MDIRTEKLAAITVLGIAAKQSNDHPEKIGEQWKRFFQQGGPKQILHRKSDDVIAIYTDYEGDHTQPYSMVIGCEVDAASDVAPGLIAKTIPAGPYMVLEARGPQPAAVMNAWKQVWSSPWKRAYLADFDRYRGPELVEVNVGIR